MPEEEETVTILFQCEDISSESMVNKMREDIMSQMTRPEDGERGLGASHRRGGTGRASYRRPPEGAHLRNFPVGKRGASATSKAPGAERKVESMRDKGAKRAASGKLHIDDGCMGGGEAIDYLPVLAWSMGRNSVCMPGSDNDFWDVKWGNGWDVDLDYHSAWKNLDHHYGYWWNYR